MGEWFGDLGQDFRFALRRLSKSPGFLVIGVLSLAVGIGINTALFSVVHAVWMKPVPGVHGSDRIVEILDSYKGQPYEVGSYLDFLDLREADTPIEDLAGWRQYQGSLGAAVGAERVQMMYVSANYFRVLGVVAKRFHVLMNGDTHIAVASGINFTNQ